MIIYSLTPTWLLLHLETVEHSFICVFLESRCLPVNFCLWLGLVNWFWNLPRFTWRLTELRLLFSSLTERFTLVFPAPRGCDQDGDQSQGVVVSLSGLCLCSVRLLFSAVLGSVVPHWVGVGSHRDKCPTAPYITSVCCRLARWLCSGAQMNSHSNQMQIHRIEEAPPPPAL